MSPVHCFFSLWPVIQQEWAYKNTVLDKTTFLFKCLCGCYMWGVCVRACACVLKFKDIMQIVLYTTTPRFSIFFSFAFKVNNRKSFFLFSEKELPAILVMKRRVMIENNLHCDNCTGCVQLINILFCFKSLFALATRLLIMRHL